MKIEHDTAGHRFTTKAGQGEAYLSYETGASGTLDLKHTIVPEDAQGRGTGEALVRAALDYARSVGARIVPSCPFVRHFLDEHADYADLVAGGD